MSGTALPNANYLGWGGLSHGCFSAILSIRKCEYDGTKVAESHDEAVRSLVPLWQKEILSMAASKIPKNFLSPKIPRSFRGEFAGRLLRRYPLEFV